MKYLGGGGFGDVYYIIDTIGGWNVPRAMKKISCNSEINENQKKELLKEAENFLNLLYFITNHSYIKVFLI